MLLLVGCTAGTLSIGDQPGPFDSGRSPSDTAEHLGPDTAGTTDTEPPPVADGIGAVALDCDSTPPLEGKITCDLRVEDAAGTVYWDGPAGVGLHGRSSSNFPKPQFAVELRDAAGEQVAADLLGMGAEADWLLNGMWIDRALMRNKLAYDLFRDLTDDREWAPESKYVEVTYNGGYYGLFTVVERIDRDKSRLDLPVDDGTGASFIVKADEAGIPSIAQYASWAVVYPVEPTAGQTEGITETLATMENHIVYADPAMWDDIDLQSATAFVLIEEVFKNNDAFFLSHHAYARPEGKIGFVPWDLDLSLGQPSYNDNENPRSWIAYRPALVGNMAVTEEFQAAFPAMWADWRANELSDDAIEARIDGLVEELGDAPERNFERWPIEDVDFGGTLYVVGSFDEEMTRVRAFLRDRLVWMDANVATY